MRTFFYSALIGLMLSCAPQEGEDAKDRAKLAVPEAQAKPNHTETELDELRVLARQQDEESVRKMIRLLSGNRLERKWALLGLGHSCRKDTSAILGQLINAAAIWAAGTEPPEKETQESVGWAIGKCATREAEEILRSWLAPDPSTNMESLIDAASLGLGTLVDSGMALSERTQTAVLDAAGREKRAELLLPLSRVGRLSDAVGAHLLEVVGNLLTQERTRGRREALFALGNAGPSAVDPLSQVLLASSFSPQERAAAAQALGRLGAAGQRGLDRTLAKLLKRGLPVEFDSPLWIPLRSTLKTLEEADRSRATLGKLSTIVLPEGEQRTKVAQRRRMTWLRCRAAELLAREDFTSEALQSCDPRKGRTFLLAQLQSIGQAPLKKSRLERFRELIKSDDPVVAQAALRHIPSHPELTESPKILLRALSDANPGTRTTAAQIVAAYPGRALKQSAEGPSEELGKALGALLTDDTSTNETRAAALRAAGALRALTLKPAVEELCDGKQPSLWSPAKHALSLLGSPKRACPKTPPRPTRVTPPATAPTTVIIDSDVGELLLHVEPDSAPFSSTHFLKAVDAGFYNGQLVHGMRLGFAVQFGDPDGDGYDETKAPGLPNEVSPEPFRAFDFGMSSFSPGEQNRQLFVLVSDAPQLKGSRVRLGRAEGPWHQLTIGDRFHTLRRK